jgi:hypothetical protein
MGSMIARVRPWLILTLALGLLATVGVYIAVAYHKDNDALSETRVGVSEGRYSDAQLALATVRLPIFQTQVKSLRAEIVSQIASDESARHDVNAAVASLAQVVKDRNNNGSVPSGVGDNVTHSFERFLSRPSVLRMSATELSKELNSGMPVGAVAIVNDLTSAHHSVRLIRFAIANPTEFSTAPSEDRNKTDCFETGLTCWYFNAQYDRLLIALGKTSEFGDQRVFVISQGDAGTFQGARLLEWRDGIAVTMAGSTAATGGGNSGATWWHVWRLGTHGQVKFRR